MIPFFTRLRGFSSVAIILLHTLTASAIIYRQGISVNAYGISMGFTYFLFFAVPCFVMVTGALLLNPAKEIRIKKILRKYVLRILLALVISSMVFRIFTMIMDGEEISLYNILLGFYQAFTGTSWSHLWYLYILIGLYLLIPLFKVFASNASKKQLKYTMLVIFVFVSIIPILNAFDIPVGFAIPITSIYPLYLFLGYMIYCGKLQISKSVGIILFLLGSVSTFVLTYLRFRLSMDALDVFMSYSSPFTVIQSVGVFSLFLNFDKKSEPSVVVRSLDSCSFGIYLFHMIFVRLIIRYMEFNPYNYGPYIFVLLVLGFLLVTWGIMLIIKRIPGLKSIF